MQIVRPQLAAERSKAKSVQDLSLTAELVREWIPKHDEQLRQKDEDLRLACEKAFARAGT